MQSIAGSTPARQVRANISVTCHDKTSVLSEQPPILLQQTHENVPAFPGFVASESEFPSQDYLDALHAALRGGDSDREAAEPPSGAAAGLVYSQTSDTRSLPPGINTVGNIVSPPLPERIQVIPSLSRLKKLHHSVLTAARLHVQSKPSWRVVMVTPTYAPGQYWCSHDITRLVKCIRQWLARRSIEMRYVWVMEYTKKGKPHYHMLVWLPLGITLPYPDKRGWWTKGWTNQEWAKNAIGYIAKYASKGSSLVQYVRGARHHGNGGMEGEALLEQRWWKLPGWMRGIVEPSDRVRRGAKGVGGYVNPETAEVFCSPYEIVFSMGQIFVQLKAVPV